MYRICLFICLLASPLLVFSQSSEYGVSLQGWNYQGDINPKTLPYVQETDIGASLFYRYNLNNNWALRGQASYGQVSGDDRNFDERKTSNPLVDFKTTFFAVEGLVEFNLLGRERRNLRLYDQAGNRFTYEELKQGGQTLYDEDGNQINFAIKLKRPVSPYITLGVGGLFFDPTTHLESSNGATFTQKELDQDFSKINFITPIGAGLKFYLNDRWTLGLEALMVPTFADYLDGASDSRDPEDNDWLSTFSLGLSYRFSEKDSDGDGIIDREDACPDLPGSAGLAGCPDSDGDGIADREDSCPMVAGLAAFNGCPDGDSDGIEDSKDACPNEAGLAAFNGCPDTDGDGIQDSQDECPLINGTVALNGCPDSDGDGITDGKDKCPNEAGLAALGGCPDSDGDGVADGDDQCPAVRGLVALGGCPDGDGDGVADHLDKCPKVKGPASNQGCPEIEKADLEKIAFAIKNVQFRTNQTRLRSGSVPVLNEIVGLMQKYPAYNLKIEGHTDSDGKEDANLKLSQGRAKACFDFLVSKGVSATRMTHAGFGESRPIADNKTDEGKTANRRVDFEMILR
ncbi:MAG: OmpA family protein [Saprospiraceae bacterium]|nr:OmpA family protein [Saprospiraceae bacterium]